MEQTTVSIRMDSELKKKLEATCADLGMNITTAFTIFAKKVAREQRIPFEVSNDPFYSDVNMERLDRSIAQLDAGKGMAHEVTDD